MIYSKQQLSERFKKYYCEFPTLGVALDLSRTNVSDEFFAKMELAWFHEGDGKGEKNMVVIPYKDRLELLARYLQQLIMESLGKQRDSAGTVVNQGLSVFGNKGSTYQHYYIQQLIYGLRDFLVTFVEVLIESKYSKI